MMRQPQQQASVVALIRAAVQALGPQFNPDILRQTRDIYRPHISASDPDITSRKDMAYGPHERHRVDVYRCGTNLRPMLVFIHGGGFVAGSKDEDGTFHRNVGEYFARHGYVTLVPNYRLAPSDPWPAGAEDVGRVLAWAADQAAILGGDAQAIHVVAQSAGASHTASWLFDPSLQALPRTGVLSVVLMAGFYQAEAPLPPPIRSYFGDDAAAYVARSPISHLGPDHPRLLLTIGELDPAAMARQTYLLAAALSKASGACARLQWFAGHNHVSTVQSLGSPQDDVGNVLRAFLSGDSGR